jgi:CheY-like chemotaxis protein
MDIRMPVLDGIAATRRISADAENDNRPRVIVLTTFDLDEYLRRTASRGQWSSSTSQRVRSCRFDTFSRASCPGIQEHHAATAAGTVARCSGSSCTLGSR